jgi:amino acid transporter
MLEQKKRLSNKHLILMILGCVIPMGLFFVLFILGVPLNKLLLFALIIICPLSHIFMMRTMMPHENAEHDSDHKKDVSVDRSDTL